MIALSLWFCVCLICVATLTLMAVLASWKSCSILSIASVAFFLPRGHWNFRFGHLRMTCNLAFLLEVAQIFSGCYIHSPDNEMGFHPHHGASFMFVSLEICFWQLSWSHATSCSCRSFRPDADVLTRYFRIPWNHRRRGSCCFRIKLVFRPAFYFSMVNLRIHCRVFEIY